MSKELFEALNVLEKENNISKEVLFEPLRILSLLPARTILERQTILRYTLTEKSATLLFTPRKRLWKR